MTLRLALPLVALGAGLACSGGQPHWPETAPDAPCDPASWPRDGFAGGGIVMDVPSGGRTRRAVVWVPETPGPWDVVVDLHEFRSDPVRQQAYSGWVPFGTDQGALVVAPDGKSATWNAGPCCGKAHEKGIDDVAFLDAVMARLDATACTTGRVLATGIGNGGMMAHTWACETDTVDAVVSVGGALQLDTCTTTRPIPLLHYHGVDDGFIPAKGGPGILEGDHKPVASAEALWRTRNGAADAEVTTTTDGALTCRRTDGSAPTVFCDVAGMKDAWPSAADAPIESDDPLKDATRGAWAWVKAAWDAPTPAAPPLEVPPSP